MHFLTHKLGDLEERQGLLNETKNKPKVRRTAYLMTSPGSQQRGGANCGRGLTGPNGKEAWLTPRPRHAPQRRDKAASEVPTDAGCCRELTCHRCWGCRRRRGSQAGRCGRKMLSERTVRLQFGTRVEAVYVLGTQIWTDVYR